MRIILSKKGFDTKNGLVPSPIFPDGTLLSFPIPDENGPHSYEELYCNEAKKNLSELLYDLTGSNTAKYKDKRTNKCHLDPDLCESTIRREPNWKPVFGQTGSSQGHLKKQGVGKSDLFLFFGRFCHVEQKYGKWSYVKSSPIVHLIFGYLEVGDCIAVNNVQVPSWLSDHPHIANQNKYTKTKKKNNTIYLSTDKLSLLPLLKGAGLLKYADKRVLTKKNFEFHQWNLPREIFYPVDISYHLNKSKVWQDDYFQSITSIGQEFVINTNKEIIQWTKELLS